MLWVDTVYEKIRKKGRVVFMAIMVITGVTQAGNRKILAAQPMWDESEETYRELFGSLKKRGLERAHLIVSDAHKGLQAAIRKEFLGSGWQRCKVHFMRNVLARVGQRDKAVFAAKLKQIGLQALYDFPMLDARKISSTSWLEQLNREIRRRSAVVGVFPSEESYVRLVSRISWNMLRTGQQAVAT